MSDQLTINKKYSNEEVFLLDESLFKFFSKSCFSDLIEKGFLPPDKDIWIRYSVSEGRDQPNLNKICAMDIKISFLDVTEGKIVGIEPIIAHERLKEGLLKRFKTAFLYLIGKKTLYK